MIQLAINCNTPLRCPRCGTVDCIDHFDCAGLEEGMVMCPRCWEESAFTDCLVPERERIPPGTQRTLFEANQ